MKKRLFICGLITLFLTLFIIITYINKHGISCPLEHFTGIYCFLCGCTRSTWAILDLNFKAAYYYNPMYFLLLPYFILKYIEISYRYIRYNEFKITKDMIFIFISVLLFMVWRNIGFMDFLLPKN